MKHKHADLIHAWADGAQIQIRDDLDDIWLDTNSPSWVAEYQYRIKPEPKPDIVHRTGIVLFEPYTDGVKFDHGSANIQLTFDGETGELKSAEVLSRGKE
jgi:hypothetical protein